jgi:hypothetical protein
LVLLSQAIVGALFTARVVLATPISVLFAVPVDCTDFTDAQIMKLYLSFDYAHKDIRVQ